MMTTTTDSHTAQRTASDARPPEPLFILCPPRSYSSVVSGIIGQHPQCYGLPELNLLAGDTLGEVWGHPSLYMRSFGRDGLLRVLAQLHEGDQTPDTVAHAREWVERHADWPVSTVFNYLQHLVGPKILVEKSPFFVHQQEFMERLRRTFPKANLLHLVRHPRTMGASVIGLLSRGRMAGNTATRDPEHIWLQSHERIVETTAGLPIGQCMRIKGETLLRNLDVFLPQICLWLGIRKDEEAMAAMLRPEDSPYASSGPRGAPRGNDPNFLENPRLDFERLARIEEPSLAGELSWRPGQGFKPATVKLARQLGYS